MTLTEFLLARIAEDEAAARAVIADNYDDLGIGTGDDPWPSEKGFAERFSPARVLAECEAKRRIVELHKRGGYLGDALDECSTCANGVDEFHGHFTQAGMPWPCPTLGALVLPYADHPDYDDAWRP